MRPRQQRGMRMEIEYKNSTTDPLHSFVNKYYIEIGGGGGGGGGACMCYSYVYIILTWKGNIHVFK